MWSASRIMVRTQECQHDGMISMRGRDSRNTPSFKRFARDALVGVDCRDASRPGYKLEDNDSSSRRYPQLGWGWQKAIFHTYYMRKVCVQDASLNG